MREEAINISLNHIIFLIPDLFRKITKPMKAFKRILLDFIDLFVFCIPAILASRSNEKRQRLCDMYAKTNVAIEVESKLKIYYKNKQ